MRWGVEGRGGAKFKSKEKENQRALGSNKIDGKKINLKEIKFQKW